MKKIYRYKKTKNFTMICNEELHSNALSSTAKVVLFLCLSYTDEWEITLPGLLRHMKEGATAVRSALAELEAAGYIERVRNRVNGKFVKSTFVVYEKPFLRNSDECNDGVSIEPMPDGCAKESWERTMSGISEDEISQVVAPQVGNPHVDNDSHNNTIKENKNEENTMFDNINPIIPSLVSNQRMNDYASIEESIRNQIGYYELRQEYRSGILDDIVALLMHVRLSKGSFIQISKENMLPVDFVQREFSRLNIFHVDQVMRSFEQTQSSIQNHRNYLLSVLLNACQTNNSYYYFQE